MRPDQTNVIVIFNKYTWKQRHIDGAIYAGGEISARALDWLKRYNSQHDRLMIVSGVTREEHNGAERTTITVFGPEEFRKDIGRLISTGRFSLEVGGFYSPS